jgi:hypothetical protein
MRTTSAERMRVLRARRRRGKLCVDLHEDDLWEIALRGYAGAASTDRELQAEAVTLLDQDAVDDLQLAA